MGKIGAAGVSGVKISRSARASAIRGAGAAVRVGLTVSVVLCAAALIFRWYTDLEGTASRMMLSFIGVALAAWLIGILAHGVRRFRKTVIVGLIGVAASQLCYHAIVWTSWKEHALAWRAWWIALIVAISAAHFVWLRIVGAGHQHIRWIAQAAAIVAALMFAGLCLGRTPLPEVPDAYFLAIGIAAAISLLATFVLWWKVVRPRRSEATKRWVRRGWLVTGQLAFVAIAFYLGRVTAPTPTTLELMPSALAAMPARDIEAQVQNDLRRLRILVDGLDELSMRAIADSKAIRETRAAEHRDYYHPAEEDRVRGHFMSYLAYRSALLRLAATYSSFRAVADPALRARCFLVGYAAGGAVYKSSLYLVRTYGDEPPARKKLNEADPACGIPAGMFDRIEESVTADRNVELFGQMGTYYEQQVASWRGANAWPSEDMSWLEQHIGASLAYVRNNAITDPTSRVQQVVRRVKNDVYQPYYAGQSLLSTWIGDTRLVGRPPFISAKQIADMQQQLQSGDILIERRNWFASNAFLPGFWPHGALYIGRITDLERLGLAMRDANGKWTSDNPAIRDHLAEYLKSAEDGAAHTVLESVSEGVIFNSLDESMHADYVGVLRPRLTDARKAQAIANAFSHQGKPYDFEFDFFSADKLVCTELVYRSYEGLLHFDLVKVMGRDTLPAIEIVRKFANERGRPDRQLDFVLFLDAVPAEGAARLASEDDFCNSIHRPRGFNE
jgi:hypothetical protein